MTLKELEARITYLEDIEKINKLKATFCYADDAFDLSKIMDLFSDDAVADFHPFGHYEGKEEIAKFFGEDLPAAFSFMVHMIHNPVIEVKGNRAVGKWYFKVPATHRATNEALWTSGVFEHEFIKLNGEWKFKRFTSNNYFITPYDEGWTKKRLVEI